MLKKSLLKLACILLSCQAFAQIPVTTPKAALNDFMAQRFGMFIHWGPVALRGTEIGWSRGGEVPTGEYDNLYKEFNPVLFNADHWVKAARDAGMKYLTITAKHHDGFALFKSNASKWNMVDAPPYGKDLLKPLAEAMPMFTVPRKLSKFDSIIIFFTFCMMPVNCKCSGLNLIRISELKVVTGLVM